MRAPPRRRAQSRRRRRCAQSRWSAIRHSRRCLSAARIAAGDTAVQRCSRAGVEARQSRPRREEIRADAPRSRDAARRRRRGALVFRTHRRHRKDTGARSRRLPCGPRRKRKNPGDDLFSRKAALSVSSALESLTSVFGMGTGMASPLESPGFVASGRGRQRLRSGPRGSRRAPEEIFDLVLSRQGSDHDHDPSH